VKQYEKTSVSVFSVDSPGILSMANCQENPEVGRLSSEDALL
jgi:hypothetical protein